MRLVATHVEYREVELVHRQLLHFAPDRRGDLDTFLQSTASYISFQVVDDSGLAAVVQADDDDLDFSLCG